MRKLCTDEVGVVKMNKNEQRKTCFVILKKHIFCTTPLLALHFKDDLWSLID
jgi:hypothetical protein